MWAAPPWAAIQTEYKGEMDLSANIHISLLPERERNVASHLMLLPPCLPHRDGLQSSGTASSDPPPQSSSHVTQNTSEGLLI